MIGLNSARNGVRPPTEVPSRASSGVKSSPSSLRSAGKPAWEAAIVPRRPAKNRFEVGRRLARRDQRRAELLRGGLQLLHQRVGVDRRSC